jgi:hypothetical protein
MLPHFGHLLYFHEHLKASGMGEIAERRQKTDKK